jgi:hypothetical protein
MVPPNRDDETGKYAEEYPDEAFLAAVDTVSPATTSSLADEVGCSYDLAYRRLQTLEAEGRLTSEDIGGSFLWAPGE